MIMKHLHHIVPKHAGGSDDPSNLIEVTVEEHAELHLALYLEHGRWQDFYAYQLLANEMKRPDAYHEIRVLAGSKPMSEEGKKRLSEMQKGKITPEATKVKISKAMKGRRQSEEHIRNANKRKFGSYLLTFRDGYVSEIRGLVEWCRQNGYNHKCLGNMMRGKAKTHKDIVGCERLDK